MCNKDSNEFSEKNYLVKWEIDIQATTPEAAALEARRCIQDPDTLANVYNVIDEEGTTTRIDLQYVEN